MSEDRDSTAYLVGFLSSFTLLIERELLAIRQSVVTTVEAVMQGIEDISSTVEQNKIDAEQILEFTYLHPDKETKVLIDDVQQLTDEVIENAFKQIHDSESEPVSTSKPEAAVQEGLTRLNVKLDESMGRLSKLDDSLSSSVFSIVGALSSEDLIAQRLEHTILSLKSLQTGLSFILIDYEERCRSEEIERVVKSILTYTYRQYTAEEEKERFRAIFGKIAV
ncbi:MAG: hypothetical protein EOP07_10720 [Proteobacteria bacterium]|nr:MAG: hypothetical protein EOP07_10720 [Pseudomonadota bacterium]